MKTAHKVFLIIMACLLILGALSLAVGSLLGGSLAHVLAAVRDAVTGLLDGFILLFDL